MNKLEMIILQQMQPLRAVKLQPNGEGILVECVTCSLTVSERSVHADNGCGDFDMTSLCLRSETIKHKCDLCSQELEFE